MRNRSDGYGVCVYDYIIVLILMTRRFGNGVTETYRILMIAIPKESPGCQLYQETIARNFEIIGTLLANFPVISKSSC